MLNTFQRGINMNNIKLNIQPEKINFCCIFGGESSEHEVSLVSAYSVLSNTNSEKYNIIKVGVTRDGKWYLYTGENDNIKSGKWEQDTENKYDAYIVPSSRLCVISNGNAEYIKIDVAFPVMHGAYSEDGRMQGLLDMCHVKYVGPGCASSAVSMDKAFTKQILSASNIPQAKAVVVTSSDMTQIDAICDSIESVFGFPVFVKPANAGSSVGVSKVADKKQLPLALEKAFKEDDKALIEEFIKGKEVEVAVMGNKEPISAIPGEIDPGADFYDYETKYVTDTASYYIPARISNDEIDTVRALAIDIYKALGCKGLSRIDFFVCDDGRIIFNELNTLPGFTSISMYPKMFINMGVSYSEIIDKLLSLAME